MFILFKIIFAIVLTEAITEIVVKSEIFLPIRKALFDNKKFRFFEWLHSLLDCGYCFSVWAGWFVALILLMPNQEVVFVSKYIDWFFIGLALHRGSNVLHYVIDCFRKWSDNGQGV